MDDCLICLGGGGRFGRRKEKKIRLPLPRAIIPDARLLSTQDLKSSRFHMSTKLAGKVACVASVYARVRRERRDKSKKKE